MNDILERVKKLKSFKSIPQGYWLCGVRSKRDLPDQFDDDMYLFKGETLIMKTTCTTNPGLPALKTFEQAGLTGAAVVKADEWYYDLWAPGLHKGKMRALRQINPILYYRDNNRNDKSEALGSVQRGIIGINFHTSSYNMNPIIYNKVGGWSYGCQVCNNIKEYYKIIDTIGNQRTVSYCLLQN